MEFWSKLLDPSVFVPPAQYGSWPSALIWLHNTTDFLLALADIAIPFALLMLLTRRTERLPFRHLLWLFSLFILACGAVHLMDIVLFYFPLYYLSGLIKVITVLLSWATLFVMFRVVPRAIAMRNPAELALEVSHRTSQLSDVSNQLHLAQEEIWQLADRMPQIVWTAQPNGSVDYFNQRWFDYTGSSPQGNLLEVAYQPVLHPDDAEPFATGWAQAVATGTSFEMEYRFKRADGTYRWHLGRAMPVHDKAGHITRWIGTCTDIDEQKSVEEALRQANARLALELEERKRLQEQLELENERMPMGRIVWDTQFRVKTWNPAARDIFGYEESEAVGRSGFGLILPEELRPFIEPRWNTILEEDIAPHYINENLTRDGRTIICEWANTAVRNEKGVAIEVLSMVQDITQREQAKAELERAKEEAELANSAKDEFLSRTSHELRTPLNAILGFAQILEMGQLSRGQREGVEHILGAGRHLLELINELLDIARITQGQHSLEVEPVSLAEVSREIWPMVHSQAEQHGVELVFDAHSWRDLHVLADGQRLHQILLNLLSNAIKYNREGGSVTLAARTLPGTGTEAQGGGQRVQIEVRDTGLGIAPEQVNNLFVPFNRLGAEKRTHIEGTGLGLTITKSLVEAMNGTLSFQSEVGQGTTFTVELPASAPALASPETIDPLASDLNAASRILYIEDNLSNYAVIEMLLSDRTGIELISAMQGRIGLELAQQHQPDLILLDVHLPDITGDEVLRQLKSNALTQGIPVVILSADATQGQIERLMAAGARAYLTKPLDIKKFLALLEDIVG